MGSFFTLTPLLPAKKKNRNLWRNKFSNNQLPSLAPCFFPEKEAGNILYSAFMEMLKGPPPCSAEMLEKSDKP
jgi:hypothetical protein